MTEAKYARKEGINFIDSSNKIALGYLHSRILEFVSELNDFSTGAAIVFFAPT